jgi:D-alanine-D-alanine ligase
VDVRYESLDEAKLAQRFDLVYIVLHGGRGEDGTIQGYLDCLGLPYTGPGVLGCAVSMDKAIANALMERAGILVPAYHCFGAEVDPTEAARAAVEALGLPLVTKPRKEGSSLGVSFCHDEPRLVEAIGRAPPSASASATTSPALWRLSRPCGATTAAAWYVR